MTSREVWADLLAAHLTRLGHVGSVVVLHPEPRLWPLAEWRAPLVWAHLAALHGQDFFAPAHRHPAPRERLHPQRDAAVLADHLHRADLRVLMVTHDAAATARLAACVPPAQWASRSLLLGPAAAAGWPALSALTAAQASGWRPLPVPGLRALASPDVAAALAALGLPLTQGARWGASEAQRLAGEELAASLAWSADAQSLSLTLTAPGAQALVCTEPGHAWHVTQQGHAVISPSGKAQLWLPYEGGGSGRFVLTPLNPSVDGAVVRRGAHAPAAAWQAVGRGASAGHALLVPAGGEAPLVQLALPTAALPAGRFCAMPEVGWTVALERPAW